MCNSRALFTTQNYNRHWGSNPVPLSYQPAALPSELKKHSFSPVDLNWLYIYLNTTQVGLTVTLVCLFLIENTNLKIMVCTLLWLDIGLSMFWFYCY